jgi:hypothetical protein
MVESVLGNVSEVLQASFCLLRTLFGQISLYSSERAGRLVTPFKTTTTFWKQSELAQRIAFQLCASICKV